MYGHFKTKNFSFNHKLKLFKQNEGKTVNSSEVKEEKNRCIADNYG